MCINFVKQLPSSQVTVQDCDVLMKSQQLPKWLNGTPTLVNTANFAPFKGSQAINHLSELVAAHVGSSKGQASSTPVSKNAVSKNATEQTSTIEFEVDDPDEQMTNLLPPTGHDVQDVQISDGKVTDQDLQAFMQMRQQKPQ